MHKPRIGRLACRLLHEMTPALIFIRDTALPLEKLPASFLRHVREAAPAILLTATRALHARSQHQSDKRAGQPRERLQLEPEPDFRWQVLRVPPGAVEDVTPLTMRLLPKVGE
jgi:hypothetical protein